MTTLSRKYCPDPWEGVELWDLSKIAAGQCITAVWRNGSVQTPAEKPASARVVLSTFEECAEAYIRANWSAAACSSSLCIRTFRRRSVRCLNHHVSKRGARLRNRSENLRRRAQSIDTTPSAKSARSRTIERASQEPPHGVSAKSSSAKPDGPRPARI